MAKLGQSRAIDSKSLKWNALFNQSAHLEVVRSWVGSPYMPRPIVSIHVRQGDKAVEMRLFSFAAHMWMAERLRFHVPNLENVWLSTEMEVTATSLPFFHIGVGLGDLCMT